MAIEIVDFPIKNGDFPWQTVSSPEGKCQTAISRIFGSGPPQPDQPIEAGTIWNRCHIMQLPLVP